MTSVELNNDKISPVKHDKREGRESVEYRFDRVFIDEVNTDSVTIPNNVVLSRLGSGELVWQYGRKPSVIIDEEQVYGTIDGNQRELEKQAYFALSILDEKGYVSRFQRK